MVQVVAALLASRAAAFELGVLAEVFGIDRTDDGVPAFDFRVCALDPSRPVPTSSGFAVVASHGLEGAADADLVAVPAGPADGPFPEPFLTVLRDAVQRGARVMSVCSGAFMLGAAGLLDGRRCATHWRYADELARRYPLAQVDLDVLYVEDGSVLTSAGTAAGIDACLHLVRADHGAQVAARIARRMVVPPHRSGGQRQYVESPILEPSSTSLQPVLDWVVAHLDRPHSVAELAARAQVSERTFARRFAAEVGSSPHRWVTEQRVGLARRLLEGTDADVESIARACGLSSGALLRQLFQRSVGVSPSTYRRQFSASP